MNKIQEVSIFAGSDTTVFFYRSKSHHVCHHVSPHAIHLLADVLYDLQLDGTARIRPRLGTDVGYVARIVG